MRELRTVDKLAYVRFASVYRDFRDEEQFLRGDPGLPGLLIPLGSAGRSREVAFQPLMQRLLRPCREGVQTGTAGRPGTRKPGSLPKAHSRSSTRKAAPLPSPSQA